MTNLREAAQMALDAMLNFPDDISDDMFESIKALRAALAQPEPEPVATLFGSLPVYDVPSKQEPVAWMYQHEDTGLTMCVVVQQVEPGSEKNNPKWQKIMPLYTAPPHFLDPAKVARLMDEAFERGKKEIDMEQVKDIAQKLADCALLNSAPPQREWMERERAVGYREGHQAALKQREWQTLTDEEMFSLWVKCPAETEDRFAFARAIEAKLKEMNT